MSMLFLSLFFFLKFYCFTCVTDVSSAINTFPIGVACTLLHFDGNGFAEVKVVITSATRIKQQLVMRLLLNH